MKAMMICNKLNINQHLFGLWQIASHMSCRVVMVTRKENRKSVV